METKKSTVAQHPIYTRPTKPPKYVPLEFRCKSVEKYFLKRWMNMNINMS